MEAIWLNLRASSYSLILHGIVLGLLTISIEFAPPPAQKPMPKIDIVEAVTVDSKEIEAELKRLQKIDQEKERKQRELEKKLKSLQKETAQAEERRKAEEKKLSEAKKQKEAQEKKRKEEEKKLAAAEKRRQELEQQRKAEEEKKRKAELERQQKEKEAALQKQLAAEQQEEDRQLLQTITAEIYQRIVNNFNKSGLPGGLECVLSVRVVPGGEVVSVSVSKSSGNETFDRRALVAVEKASPLPIPEDAAIFERLNLRQIALRFKPEN